MGQEKNHETTCTKIAHVNNQDIKTIFTSILSVLFIGNINASTESEFIKDHIKEFYDLNKTVIEFENQLLNVEQKDTALKYIDTYSLALEKSLSVYAKYKTSDNELISEVTTDLTKMLTDIMNNNYQLLGKFVKSGLSKEDLKQETRPNAKPENVICRYSHKSQNIKKIYPLFSPPYATNCSFLS